MGVAVRRRLTGGSSGGSSSAATSGGAGAGAGARAGAGAGAGARGTVVARMFGRTPSGLGDTATSSSSDSGGVARRAPRRQPPPRRRQLTKAATFPMRAASARRIKWADEPSAGPGSCLHTVHLITPRSERLEVELLPIDGGDRDDDLPEYALPAATSFTSALRSALCRCL